MISFKSAAKTTAEHGTGETEEAQTLLSKTNENYSIQTYPSKILYRTLRLLIILFPE
jgi:hypothetical protein